MRSDLIEIPEVEVLAESEFIVQCRVGETIVELARVHFHPGTEVAHVGDRGRAFVPYALAIVSGLTRCPPAKSLLGS